MVIGKAVIGIAVKVEKCKGVKAAVKGKAVKVVKGKAVNAVKS